MSEAAVFAPTYELLSNVGAASSHHSKMLLLCIYAPFAPLGLIWYFIDVIYTLVAPLGLKHISELMFISLS